MQISGVVNPLNLAIIDASGYDTGQGYLDGDHVAEITASMAADGWRGAPLVVLSDYARAYTGTHRLAAAQAAGLERVPAVELADVFAACGLDLWEACEEGGLSVLMDREQVIAHLPADVAAAYGLDDVC